MSLFDNYSVKGTMKYFREKPDEDEDDDKLIISIGIKSNHELTKDIYLSISKFLENMLIEDYLTEEQYLSIQLQKKEEEKMKKVFEKRQKEQMKQQHQQQKGGKTNKSGKKKSLY